MLLEMEMRNTERRDKRWECIHTFGFEDGRSTAEVSTAIRVMATAAREWGAELGVIACFMDVKQAFDNDSPESLRPAMKGLGVALVFGRSNFEGAD